MKKQRRYTFILLKNKCEKTSSETIVKATSSIAIQRESTSQASTLEFSDPNSGKTLRKPKIKTENKKGEKTE